MTKKEFEELKKENIKKLNKINQKQIEIMAKKIMESTYLGEASILEYTDFNKNGICMYLANRQGPSMNCSNFENAFTNTIKELNRNIKNVNEMISDSGYKINIFIFYFEYFVDKLGQFDPLQFYCVYCYNDKYHIDFNITSGDQIKNIKDQLNNINPNHNILSLLNSLKYRVNALDTAYSEIKEFKIPENCIICIDLDEAKEIANSILSNNKRKRRK